MDLSKMLKMTMLELNINQIQLAELTNQTQANLSKKITLNNFKIKEYERLLSAMGCKLEVNILLPNGKVIK